MEFMVVFSHLEGISNVALLLSPIVHYTENIFLQKKKSENNTFYPLLLTLTRCNQENLIIH